jgi:hypothetical protein
MDKARWEGQDDRRVRFILQPIPGAAGIGWRAS